MLVTFKTSNHRNYAKEAVNLLLQYNYLFSDRQKAQLLWNRCVNTTGRPGANIPCDLHDEHLNRRFKIILRGQGANVNPRSVERAGKSIASVHHICQIFEEQQPPPFTQTIIQFQGFQHHTPSSGGRKCIRAKTAQVVQVQMWDTGKAVSQRV